jgi:hypothetical protein
MIGNKPQFPYTAEELKYMSRMELLAVVSKNGWNGALFEGSTWENWNNFATLTDLRAAILAKMEEHTQEVTDAGHYKNTDR